MSGFQGICNTDISASRAVLHCLPAVGPLLYMQQGCDIETQLKALFGGRTFVAGDEAQEARELRQRYCVITKLFGVQSMITVAILASLVALGVLALEVAGVIAMCSTLIPFVLPGIVCGTHHLRILASY